MVPILAFAVACNHYGGTPHAVEGVVLEAGGTSVVLRHEGVPEVLEAGEHPFIVDPNLSRKVQPGDTVEANVLVTPQGDVRAIGFVVTGHEQVKRARPLELGEPFPRFEVPTTQGPRVVGVGQDGPLVLTYLFTTCPLPAYCPLLAFKLGNVQEQLDAHILSITLDPANDSLEVLEAYGADKGADPAHWTFGRVELDQLEEMMMYSGATREELDNNITHTLKLVVLDSEGRVAWTADDNSWEPEELAAAVEKAR